MSSLTTLCGKWSSWKHLEWLHFMVVLLCFATSSGKTLQSRCRNVTNAQTRLESWRIWYANWSVCAALRWLKSSRENSMSNLGWDWECLQLVYHWHVIINVKKKKKEKKIHVSLFIGCFDYNCTTAWRQDRSTLSISIPIYFHITIQIGMSRAHLWYFFLKLN